MKSVLTIEGATSICNSLLTKYSVSVVLCTYNPRSDLLAWALESIANQSLKSVSYEVILVDNSSEPEIDLSEYSISQVLPIQKIREDRQGLIFARLAGIRASNSDLIVFVDDDNYLDVDYLKNAINIANTEEKVGLFGGISYGCLEAIVPNWKIKLLPYLGVRDYGAQPITSFETCWGKWEPIGAGMVARREICEAYVSFVENNPACDRLGRQGDKLYSCEDSLFARVANQNGFACSYQPLLSLKHCIPERRLRSRYLIRLIMGLGRSYVRLEQILGRDSVIQSISLWEITKRLLVSVSRGGIAGFYQWLWNIGYRNEIKDSRS